MLAADVTLSYSIHGPVFRQKIRCIRTGGWGWGHGVNGTLSGSNLSPPVGLSPWALPWALPTAKLPAPFQGATQAFRRLPRPRRGTARHGAPFQGTALTFRRRFLA